MKTGEREKKEDREEKKEDKEEKKDVMKEEDRIDKPEVVKGHVEAEETDSLTSYITKMDVL